MSIIDILELVGVSAFAISGATTAIKKKMDVFGVLFLAMVTAIGGGVIRDVVMNVGVPVFFMRYEYTIVILAAAAFTMLLKGHIKWKHVVFLFDAVGLAVFAVYAGIKAIELEYNLLSFLFVCVISGVGCGILRDLFAGEPPVVLHKEVYATAAFLGALVLWFIYPLIGRDFAAYVSIGIIIAIRVICQKLKLSLPSVNDTDLSAHV